MSRNVKKLSLRTCAFFDLVNFDEDKENFENAIKSLNRDLGRKVIDNVLITSYVDDFEDAVPNCDVCFIDFGGLDCGGMSGLLDSTVRHFEKLLEENENKFFVFILNMPIEFYLDEDLLNRPNIIKADANDLKLVVTELLKKFGL